jgi:hypothetical protein
MKQRIDAVQGDHAAAPAARPGSYQVIPATAAISATCGMTWSSGNAEMLTHPVFADTTKPRLARLTEASP